METATLEINERQQEEMRQFTEYLAGKADVTAKLESVLRSLFEQHRQAFVAEQVLYYLSLPKNFLEGRQANETVEAYYKRVGKWPNVKDQSEESGQVRKGILSRIKSLQPWVILLTTHPDVTSTKPNPPFWKDQASRDEWLDSVERKAFKVKYKDNAEALARKQAEADAEKVFQIFLYKTLRKLEAILTKSPDYYALLTRSVFDAGAIEGDVRLTFVDTRSFVVHVIVKYNRTADGSPYVQYPLTFHDIYGGKGVKPVKQDSQEAVEAMFGIEEKDRWTPPPAVKQVRFQSVKPFDVVKIEGKKGLAQIRGKDRKKKGNYLAVLADDGTTEVSVPLSKVDYVAARFINGQDEIKEGKTKRRVFWFYLQVPGPAVGEPEKVFLPVKMNEKCVELHGSGGNYAALVRKYAFDLAIKKGLLPAVGKHKQEKVLVG